MLINKLQNKLIIIFAILFYVLLSFFIAKDVMLILLGLGLFVLLDLFLNKALKFKTELRILFYLLILFLILESIYSGVTSNIQKLSLFVEAAIMFSIVGFSLIKNKNNFFTKEFKILTIILIGLISCNFISTMLVYQSYNIFISSIFNYCKYFSLIYFIMLSKIDKKDILKLLSIFSVVVIACTIISFFQYFGNIQFFNLFRGRFDIVIRNGSYRSIGFFTYPIELGNYSAVFFCLYYYLNKYIYKTTWFYIVSFLLVVNIVLSGTRIALIAIILVFIFSNLKSIRQILFATVILIVAFLMLNCIINIQQVITDTSKEYIGLTPRQYYIEKGIDVWKDNPLFGIGFGTYGSMPYRLKTGDLIFNKYKLHEFDSANLMSTDSFVSEVMPEFGIFGMLLLFLFGRLIYTRYKILDKQDNSNRAYIYVFLTVCILSFNSSSVFFSPHVGTLFWISMGMILNNYDLIKVKLIN